MRKYLFLILVLLPAITACSCRSKTPSDARSSEEPSDSEGSLSPVISPETVPPKTAGEEVVEAAEGTVVGDSDTDDLLFSRQDEDGDKFEFDHSLGQGSEHDPFGSSHEAVVEAMLKMAGTRKTDVVYDLGSGDGRFPIMAAQKFGARGVGVEIRRELVEESRRNAKEAGVAKRVRFIHGDMFKTDISEATVVTLYLFPRTNLKLRPMLLTQLRPGTRVVAHDFGVEGWPRDREKTFRDPDYPEDFSTLYFWVVPANVSGNWRVSPSRKDIPIESFDIHLEQTFQHVKGMAKIGNVNVPLKNVMLRGANFTFSVDLPHPAGTWKFTGNISHHRLKGVAQQSSDKKAGTSGIKTRWQAVRDPETMTPIDPMLRESGEEESGTDTQ